MFSFCWSREGDLHLWRMMAKRGWAARAVAALRRGADFLQQAAKSIASSSTAPHIVSPNASLAFAVAITAVAGLVVAAALGGTLFFSVSLRKRKRSPLTPKQWCAGFDSVSGRLINHHKVLEKIRFGGIDPSIRADVWPFLLGFYELDSTREEQESEKRRKRELYIALKLRCNILRDSIHEATLEYENSNESTKMSSDVLSSSEEEQKNADAFECEKVSSDGLSSPSEDQKDAALASDESPSNSNIEDTEDDSEQLPKVKSGPPTGKDREVTLAPDNASTPGKSNEENVKDEELLQTKNESLYADLKIDSLKATDDFINCQRIIRLDAVRMNAEWVPYSPSQANVTKELAFELARNVDLKDDEHLEPCRQHHAARLVAILEAYALYDPESGYCQGMSDLLSPFVALLDEDYEAFWCFVQFMNTARYNFRSDETGIRRQLNKLSSVFKAADPRLYSHFESIDAENCFFAYRMVVVLLRRELTFEQTISLWEVIWAEKRALSVSHGKTTGEKMTRKTFLTEDLILFVIAAAVRQKRKVIIEKCRGLDELLRECNSMAGHLDVWKLLNDAREMAYAVSQH